MYSCVLSVEEKLGQLKLELRKIGSLGAVMELLEWDHQVFLPENSHELRAQQVSAMTEMLHRAKTRPELGELIESLHGEVSSFPKEAQVVVEDARKSFLRNTCIPESFAAKKAERQIQAYQVWLKAREAKDFSLFQECLKEQIDLCKEEAAYVGTHDNAYDFWLDTFDPGMTAAMVERLFTPLSSAIAEMVPVIVEAQKQQLDFADLSFDIPKQRKFAEEVVQKLGFDFKTGTH